MADRSLHQSSLSRYFVANPEKEESPVKWQHVQRHHLELRYAVIYPKQEADELFEQLEKEVEYEAESMVRVFGKWHRIPRQQVAFGDAGLSYKFSGSRVAARQWTPLLLRIKERVERLAHQRFNFVLINRYKDGFDHIGEHRDDESELDPGASIASISLGQPRELTFRHTSVVHSKRGRESTTELPPPSSVTLTLQHGSLLFMDPPTNEKWYHSLPVRKKALLPRINLTFRLISTPSAKRT